MTGCFEFLKRTLPMWLIVLLAGIVAVVSLPVLSHPDSVFLFNDASVETQLADGSRPPGTLLQHWNKQFFFGLGMRAAAFNTVNLLEWLLGSHQYRRWGVLIAIVFVGWAAYAGCRLSGRSRAASFVAGMVAGLCGWTVTSSMAGLTSRAWLLGWVFLAVGLITCGKRRGRWPPYLVAGGVLGMAISDSPDIGVLAALGCALYFVLLHFSSKEAFEKTAALKNSGRFAAFVVVCALVASQTVLNMYELYVRAPEDASAEATPPGDDRSYEWATQWSLPFNETWSLVVCDFHGASSRSTTDPYWGRMGRSAGFEQHGQGYENFKLSGYALGTVPIVLLLFGWVYVREAPAEERRFFFILNGMALLCLMLSWGKYHLLYRLFFELPLMGSIRNPEKWLFGFLVFILLAAAVGFDFLARHIEGSEDRKPAQTGLVLACAAILPTVLLLSFLSLSRRPAFVRDLGAVGFGGIAETAYTQAMHALIIALICAAVSGAVIVLAVIKKRKWLIPAVAVVLVLMSVIELTQAASPYVMPHQYLHMLEENPLISIFEENSPDNRIKVLPPRDDLLNHFRLTWLYARGFKLFDPISVRNMPPDYAEVFEMFENNQLLLWKLGAVRFFACTPQIAAHLLKQTSGHFEVAAMFTFTQTPDGGIRPVLISGNPAGRHFFFLLEYRDALPYARISRSVEMVGSREEALQILGVEDRGGRWVDSIEAPDLNIPPANEGFHDSVGVLQELPTELRLDIETEAPGVLVVAEAFDPHWTADVGGEETPIYRANGILQGIRIPAGSHEVTLRYRPPRAPLYLALVGRGMLMIVLAIGILSFSKARRKNTEAGQTTRIEDLAS